jgi:hypothetical protein
VRESSNLGLGGMETTSIQRLTPKVLRMLSNSQLSDTPHPTKMPSSRKNSIALCAQALALQEEGISTTRIKEITGLSIATIYCIKKSHF